MPGLKYGRAFMIGWYCDIYIGDSDNILSLSNLTKVETHRPYCILTTDKLLDGSYKGNFDTPSEAYSHINSIVGNDVNTIYSTMSNGSGSVLQYSQYIDNLVNAFPSWKVGYPNLFNMMKNGELANKYIYVIIPSMGIAFSYILSQYVSSKKFRLYRLNGDSLTSIYYTASSFHFFVNSSGGTQRSGLITNASINIVVRDEYTSYDDIKNPSRWGFFVLKSWEPSTTRKLYDLEYYRITDAEVNLIINYLFNSPPDFNIISPPNPFDPIDLSGPNTPGGKFDDTSDIIGDSDLPSLSASDTGFTRIYIPTLSQVQDLARYLWTDETVVETIWNKIKQFFENPMEAIIGFNLVPIPVPSSGTKSFALMYIDTGVDMDTAANQFVDVDCGTFKLEYYYGSALDYSPYTKVSCFLPYIGMVQLNTDEVMNRTLQVKYRIDIVSGSCVAKIFVDGNCIYQYSGHCAITIPISASDFTSYVSAAISVAKLAVGAAVGGAAGAVSAALQADVAQQTGGAQTLIPTPPPSAGAIIPASVGGALGPVMPQQEQPSNTGSTSASFSGLTPKNISNTVGEIMGSKPHVQHSGSFSGNSGYLGVRRPFLIIERPNLCLPENYQQLNGFPAMITMLLGECSGYTRVQQVELTGLPATNPEQAEILELLKSGVIF